MASDHRESAAPTGAGPEAQQDSTKPGESQQQKPIGRVTRAVTFFDSTTKVLLAVGGLIAAATGLWAGITHLASSGTSGGSARPTTEVTIGPSHATSPSASAGPTAPESSALPSFGAFVGAWEGHGRSLVITADGHFTISARTYKVCGQDPPPCDTFSGNSIQDGDVASGQLSTLSGDSATGEVTQTTDQIDTPEGQVIMALDPQTNIITAGGSTYCGPLASAGACGA